MPPLFALAILAAYPPVPGSDGGITNDQAQLISWGINGVILVVCLQVLSVIFAGVKAIRKTPPLHETYATKSEAAALDARITKAEARSDANLKEIFDELRTIHRSLGRVEGLENSVKSMHEDTNERLKELNARLKS